MYMTPVTTMNLELDPRAINKFQQNIMDWWKENARDLPWRKDPNPYHVLISEIMLQQTQVNRVVPKYLKFLEEFPTLESLAAAETKHLLRVWSGLGYNRRALWLREAADQIIKRGGFPTDIKELRKLKGVGPYTSRSILIFAFNRDIAAVDTNIRRVMIAAGFAAEEMTESQLHEVAETLLLRGHSRDWHNALMDYGSDVLTSVSTGIAPPSRQPCFRGSTRELRGAVIRTLTKAESLTLNQLEAVLDVKCDKTDLMVALDQLVAEKLVSRTQTEGYRIAD